MAAVIAVASLATSDYSGFWAPLTVLLLAGSMLVIRRSPDLAARMAVAGLILLGLAGLAVAIGAQRALRFGDPSGYPLLGAVIVSSEVMVGLAVGQAVGLLGLGCWLVPRACSRRCSWLSSQTSTAPPLQQLKMLHWTLLD